MRIGLLIVKSEHRSHKRAIVAISRDEARIWSSGLDKGTHPRIVRAPDDQGLHRHVREAQHHRGHGSDPAEKGFFDILGNELSAIDEILL